MLDSTRYQAETSQVSDPAIERSLTEDIKALVSDGRLLAEAEFDFHKKRVLYGAAEGQRIAINFAIAGVVAFFAAMALVVGLVLALGQVITYWGSTAVVTVSLLVVAWIFASKGKSRLARLKAVLTDEKDPA
ncbi:phage holin family protein [Croceicoccus ponticola]|uniref:Phage holin family protein n=1 Tax=Croceicoccus ponticola TaxID=2217664 RepID=A0A437H0V9_9SPHN|nr:phage holin family protein [Croceicoccus ponticola]RVQ69206.1 phage holin family protein [Croceicoccus ponticola]